jgi:hypothetical protein
LIKGGSTNGSCLGHRISHLLNDNVVYSLPFHFISVTMTDPSIRSFLVQLHGPDGILKQGVQPVSIQNSFEDAFDSLEWGDGFELTCVELLADIAGSEPFSVGSLDAQIEEELSSLLELASVNVRCLRFFVKKKQPHPRSQPPSALAHLMQSSREQQVKYIADTDVCTWLKQDSAKGQLALQVATWLREHGVSFSPEQSPAKQKAIFLSILDVVWSVTPALKVSLSSDLMRYTVPKQKAAVQAVWHLAGKERNSPFERHSDARSVLAKEIQKAEGRLTSWCVLPDNISCKWMVIVAAILSSIQLTLCCSLTKSSRWKPVVEFLSGLWELVCLNQERLLNQNEAQMQTTGEILQQLHTHTPKRERVYT